MRDPDLADLERAIESVEANAWPARELCVVDDGSSRPDVLAYLGRVSARPNVRFRRHDVARGIAAATNAAIELAGGEYLLFLDHDDELAAGAIDRLVSVLRDAPATDLVYSDHDRVDGAGRRIGVDRKPGWSPELLLSYMYLGHLKVVRTSLARSLGGYREGFDGAADYDFALRLAEQRPSVLHVPRVLYHWRAAAGSIARDARSKRHAFESGRRALESALARRGIAARAEWPGWARRAGVGVYRTCFETAATAPVAVVILSRGDSRRLRDCVSSLEKHDSGRRRTIVTADASRPGAALTDVVRALDAEFVVFLDERVLVSSEGWIDELLGFAAMSGIGAVGAKIVGGDGRILHAGTVLGIDGGAASAFAGRRDADWPLAHGYFLHTPRDCSGVSMHAMMIRRDVFLAAGGFDDRFADDGQCDTDLCLRLQEIGLRIVSDPYAVARLPADAGDLAPAPPQRATELRSRWSTRLLRDPYYHPAFTRHRADFTPRVDRVETSTDGFPLTDPDEERIDLDPSELLASRARQIDALEVRLGRFPGMTRTLSFLLTSPLALRLRRSRTGTAIRRAIRGTRLERVLGTLQDLASR